MSRNEPVVTEDRHTETNPLLAPWGGRYGGVPPFDRIEVGHFKSALDNAMRQMASEIAEIRDNTDPPTFENTIAALERSGQTLERVLAIYGVWGSNRTSADFQAVEREMNPRLAAHWDRIKQDEGLFRRIEAVYEGLDPAVATEEERRLAWKYHTSHLRSGARLEPAAKARVAAINERLAALFTEFSVNLLADEARYSIVLESEADVEGMSESWRSAAAVEAESRGVEGWVITNTRSSVEPFLTYAARRDLRERAWRMFVERGNNGDENDNKPLITEILRLRAERARLLGYETHAHYRLELAMAGTPDRAMELMRAVWDPAVARVREEVAEMQAIVDEEGGGFEIEPWDYRYYAEKVRQRKYELDQEEIMRYLRLDRMRDAMFWVAGELFDLSFDRVDDVPTFHPDVEVWAVTDRDGGSHRGLFYFDPFARSGKRSGAWMTNYRNQSRLDGEVTTLVSNNSNFVKGRPGEPVLISWTDAVTLFHEFGHALNGLASDVRYPSLSGTPSERDYVEFPSQLLEHWLATPEVLRRFALHYRTGEPMPEALAERIDRAGRFNQGFATVEYLVDAIVDMELHLGGGADVDPAAYEEEALERLGMPREIVMRHRLPHFAHAFSSDSYSAGYYGYLWADVLTADAYEAFLDGEGPFDREIARRLYEHVLSKGGSLDPAEGYRRFRGRDADVAALMRKRGLVTEGG